jgi:adenosylcobinamide kinase/adenosylcobinamide-phosphate guanylyltransferase
MGIKQSIFFLAEIFGMSGIGITFARVVPNLFCETRTQHYRISERHMKAQIVFVTGGARSGKSAFAESLFQDMPHVVYLATARITDDEMQERIRHHQQSRPSSWITRECSRNLGAVCESTPQPPHILLDCVSILASNRMFDLTGDCERISPGLQQQVEDTIVEELERLITEVRARNGRLVMVTNEVGDAIVPENYVARVYRDILGRVNQRIAALCDSVYLVTCGIPLQLK